MSGIGIFSLEHHSWALLVNKARGTDSGKLEIGWYQRSLSLAVWNDSEIGSPSMKSIEISVQMPWGIASGCNKPA
ncbi:hypothetical protein Tco_1509765 [Tanacetum coccineum]